MGDVLVTAATFDGTRVKSLAVRLHGLADRTIDRETALAWMNDGHSLIPWISGERGSALQRVETQGGTVIRVDNQPVDEDLLPPLPEL